MATVTRTLKASAHVAVAVRLKDPERETVARRNLAEAQIADAIERAIAVAPPLTPEQIKRLSGLLRTGGSK
ncbi:hypothetical protein [Microbacterium hominis]|uniref:hypothetical protein n=1 Tax=Microbacterium hominis TaxID=162426 RepID=UPI00076862D1|nr:hypothetical protein [Microbacterium hominis]KXC06423.1 hypothetical protein MhomT_05670 [Microbacterium hominis]